MRIFGLLGIIACLTAPAQGAFLAETAFSAATRVEMGTTTGPISYALNSGQLMASIDGRSSGSLQVAGLKFAIPASTSIASATLTLTIIQAGNTASGSAASVAATVAGFATTSTALTLNDFALSSTMVNGFSVPASTVYPRNLTVALDVTSYLQSLVASQATTVGFRIDDSTQQAGFFFSAPDDPTVAYRPTLNITYAAAVPEPSSLLLVAAGLMVAVGSRYRRASDRQESLRN